MRNIRWLLAAASVAWTFSLIATSCGRELDGTEHSAPRSPPFDHAAR